ncbi:MAG TPA: ParB/RepB/Spo0J family partition protein, partial [Acidimicrobiales bacterium]
MTDTIQTPAATATDEASEAVQAEEFLYLDPADIIIGTNVRTDLRADHKEFRKSIKERGVLEAVTVYRNEDGQYVLLRGQRRTVTAAEVGTPTGLIPARVVPQPADADRIGDQMVENIHRAGMREAEIVAGVEQLALLGVSAAQIAKRTSIDHPTVNAALVVTKADQSRNRLDSGDLTLEEAAIFAEFEHDPEAVERLENAKRWRRSLAHEAQRLRDEAAEREAD